MEMSRELAAKVRALDAKEQKEQEQEQERLPPVPDSSDERGNGYPLSYVDPILLRKLSVDDLEEASINTADILSGIEESSSDPTSSNSSEDEYNSDEETKEVGPSTPISGYSSVTSGSQTSAIHTPVSLSKEDKPYDIVDYVIGDLDEEEILKERNSAKKKRHRSTIL